MQKMKRRLDDTGDLKERKSFNKKKPLESSEYVEKEHLLRKKHKLGCSFSDSKAKFVEAVCQSVSYVCSCCHQVWFEQSVKKVSAVVRMSPMNKSLLDKCVTGYLSVENCE